MAFSSSQNTTVGVVNFEVTNTVKQGKNAKRTNGTHFTRVQGGSLDRWPGIEYLCAVCGTQGT